MNRILLAVLACLLTSAIGIGQVDLVYSNVGSGARHGDSIMIFTAATGDRLLAHESESRTGSVVSRPAHVNIGGTDYLYWYDNIADAVVRATDSNGTGVLDPIEMETVFDSAPIGGSWSPDSFRYENGVLLIANDGSASAGSNGIWELTDLNNDGDYDDAGEAVRIVDGTPNTTMIAGQAISIDDIESADYLGDGSIVFYEDDNEILLRYDPATGLIGNWLNYQGLNATAALTLNPDFMSGALPATSGDLDRVTVDTSTTPATVYVTTNFATLNPYIFRCVDVNGNGTVNDAGEVTLWYDGTVAPTPTMGHDDIMWYQGSIYGSHEDPATSTGDFFQLTDINGDGDAMDAGEQVILGGLASDNDPTMLAVTPVPAGTFGNSTCNEVDLAPVSYPSAGGNLVFNLSEIPTSHQGVGAMGFVAISGTAGGNANVGGCIGGLTIDSLTNYQLANWFTDFSTGPIVNVSEDTAGFNAPPLPAGMSFYYTGILLGGPTTVVTQSRQVIVQ